MKELIEQRIKAYEKDQEEIRNKIPITYDEDELRELNDRYNRYTAVIEELNFILRKIEEV